MRGAAGGRQPAGANPPCTWYRLVPPAQTSQAKTPPDTVFAVYGCIARGETPIVPDTDFLYQYVASRSHLPRFRHVWMYVSHACVLLPQPPLLRVV